jgi:hypothetical protein
MRIFNGEGAARMTFAQIAIFIAGPLCLVVIALVYRKVHSISTRMPSIAERIWGPAWVTALVFSGFLFGVEIKGKGIEGYYLLGVCCLFLSFVFYQAWQTGLDEESD